MTFVITGYKNILLVDDVTKDVMWIEKINGLFTLYEPWVESKVLTIGYSKTSFIYTKLLIVLYQWILQILVFIGDYYVATILVFLVLVIVVRHCYIRKKSQHPY